MRSDVILNKMDDMLQELGLEEEMEKMVESFTDNFMISGEITEDLQEALKRAPDGLLDMIWDCIVRRDLEEEMDRNQKEEALYHAILEDLESNMIYMEPEKLKLYMRVACGAPIDLIYTATVNEEFVPRGWVFNFLENGSCTFVVMRELLGVLEKLREPELQEKWAMAFSVRCAVNIYLGLYGIFPQEKIEEGYRQFLSKAGGGEEKLPEQDMIRVLNALEEQGLFWKEDGYIISPYLQTKEEYRGLLKEQKGKEYYLPDAGLMDAYAQGKTLEITPEYNTVKKYLTKELKDSEMAEEMLEEIAGNIVRDEWSIPQVMNCLYEWDVAFENDKVACRFTAALSEWIYAIRRWSECGHSRKELGKENEELQYVIQAEEPRQKAVAAKVYPNDPCPCGSGKKYKKCCGR